MNEREITIHLKVSRRTLVWAAAALLLCCSANEVVSESMTLTTYYPAPAGTYKRLTTTGPGNTVLARDGGNIGIGIASPGEKLDVNGNVRAASFYYSSDVKLKKDVKLIPDALNKILRLRGVEFVWKQNNEPGIGLIAQEAEKIFPELVNTDAASGRKSLQYGNVVAPLVEAIKEQQKQIEELKKEIQQMKVKADQ